MDQSNNVVQTNCCRVDKKPTEGKNCEDCKTKDVEINKLGKQIRELIEKMKQENQSKASLQRDLNCLGLLYNQLEEKYGHLGHIQREYWDAKFENRDEFVKRWEELDKFVHDTWEKDHEEHRYMHQVKCESDDVEAKNKTLKAHNIDLIEANAHLRKEHERKNGEMDTLKAELQKKNSELKDVSTRNSHLENEWKEMKNAVQGANEMSREHDRILEIKHEAIGKLEEEKKTMRTERTEMELEIDTLRAELQKHKDKSQKVTEKYKQLETESKEMNKELREAKVLSRDHERTTKSNKETITKLEDEKKVVERKLAEIRNELERNKRERLRTTNTSNVFERDYGSTYLWQHSNGPVTRLNNLNGRSKSIESTFQTTTSSTTSEQHLQAKRKITSLSPPNVQNAKGIQTSTKYQLKGEAYIDNHTYAKIGHYKHVQHDASQDFCNTDNYKMYYESDARVSHTRTAAYRAYHSSTVAQEFVNSDAFQSYKRTGDREELEKCTAYLDFLKSSAYKNYMRSDARKQLDKSSAFQTYQAFCDKFEEALKEKKQPKRKSNAGRYGKAYQTEKDLATSEDADTLTIDSGVVSDAFSV